MAKEEFHCTSKLVFFSVCLDFDFDSVPDIQQAIFHKCFHKYYTYSHCSSKTRENPKFELYSYPSHDFYDTP